VTITLGHVWIAVALIDLVFGVVTLRRAAADGLDADRRRGLRFSGGALIATAILLVLLALFLPIGRMRLI
jgi:hypothetical protein